ncbi:ATP-binding protein [Sphingomonas sp.]|uniref:sensor histidine kinase n=1 Tax=Sphingomonas sp. TaxID=28214 RepID=UPI00286DBB9F|nr:ATP-binding protein [Sphingomonas sp.]
MPPRLTELGIGLLSAVIALGLRLALSPLAGDRAPFAFVFVGLIVATVLAGWRSGLVALVGGQLLSWYLVVEPQGSFALPDRAQLGGLAIATVSELIVLTVIALYQREIDRAGEARERRLDLLGEALSEIDHRTRNNYQTGLALVLLQARQAPNGEVREALTQVADRIKAVSLATEQLALRSDNLGTVRLGDHLRELCSQLHRGLSRDEVRVECVTDDITASAEKAIYISVIVNELVTNALKHAFDATGRGVIRVRSSRIDDGAEFLVEDDGAGIQARPHPTSGGGLGTKLVARFVRQLGATHHVASSGEGTTHRLYVPSLQ